MLLTQRRLARYTPHTERARGFLRRVYRHPTHIALGETHRLGEQIPPNIVVEIVPPFRARHFHRRRLDRIIERMKLSLTFCALLPLPWMVLVVVVPTDRVEAVVAGTLAVPLVRPHCIVAFSITQSTTTTLRHNKRSPPTPTQTTEGFPVVCLLLALAGTLPSHFTPSTRTPFPPSTSPSFLQRCPSDAPILIRLRIDEWVLQRTVFQLHLIRGDKIARMKLIIMTCKNLST